VLAGANYTRQHANSCVSVQIVFGPVFAGKKLQNAYLGTTINKAQPREFYSWLQQWINGPN
jgi:hypothetical protein